MTNEIRDETDIDNFVQRFEAGAAAGDMPILSGVGAESTDAGSLVECAGVLVRAEANLGAMVSEMRLGDDGTATNSPMSGGRSGGLCDVRPPRRNISPLAPALASQAQRGNIARGFERSLGAAMLVLT